MEPLFIGIQDAAKLFGVSEWIVKNDYLRRGVLRARKAGRRTLIEYDSVKEFAAALPKAKFAAPRRKPGEE